MEDTQIPIRTKRLQPDEADVDDDAVARELERYRPTDVKDLRKKLQKQMTKLLRYRKTFWVVFFFFVNRDFAHASFDRNGASGTLRYSRGDH